MSFANRYGFFDRMLHRVAFGSGLAQVGLADLEEKMFARELAEITPGPPVFITALPRAGTTMLLELIAALPEFAAHTYREMPFVLTPLLWRKFAGRSRAPNTASRERAHGDGIQVSIDSPEAFEEMVWLRFWKQHYRTDRITPWTRCDSPEFVEFFAAHRKKIIALGRRADASTTRYVSKNNQNIARLPSLASLIDGAVVLVAVRDPLQHAASLVRQHRRFSLMHEEDPFARRYMAGIGHFDFGANLKSIDFGGWIDARVDSSPPTTLRFWLEYWIATYRHVLAAVESDPRIQVVAFEALGQPRTLAPLAESISVSPAGLDAQLGRLRPAKPYSVEADSVTRALCDNEARPLYAALCSRSILPLG